MPGKSEKEKMLAGELYNCLDSELALEREKAKIWLRQYNLTETEAERQTLLPQLLGQIGHNSVIEPPFYCSYGRHIFIGQDVYLNFSCTILDNNEVHIGNNVMIGPAVQIYTAAHALQAELRIKGWETAKPIVIGEKVWVGGGAIILPGVIIGKNAVIGAGAVVNRNVLPHTVVAGNPARIIKELER